MSEDRPHHLIVADDEAITGLALERFLVRKGFRVSLAADGLKALEIHGRDPADLLVTDVRMPRLPGGELVRRIRAQSPDLPVVVATGYMSSDSDMPPGPRTVLMTKPLDPQELLETVRRLLGAGGPGIPA